MTGLVIMNGSASEFSMESGLSIHRGYHLNNCSSSEVFVPYSNSSGKSIGLCVEKARRGSTKYNAASAVCMSLGKRLMNYEEWRFACDGRTSEGAGTTRTGLGNMPSSGWEWASSHPSPSDHNSDDGSSSLVAGDSSCSAVSYSWVRTGGRSESSYFYRCVR